MQPFAHPERLWLFALLVPIAAWAALGARRRSRDWESLGQSGRPPVRGSRSGMASMALLVLALAQPRWGRVLKPDAPTGHDVFLLVDVSRSMAAEDAVPERLTVAIESGLSLLGALGAVEGNRAGVVAFAGRGVVRCPLTANLEAAADVLRSLRTGDVQPGGTDLGAALDLAIGAFDEQEHAEGRTIVVFSDGEDHVGSWASEVDRLRSAVIIVHSVAIGDPDKGHPIPLVEAGSSRKRREPPIETRRSDVAFEAISRATGGAVVPARPGPERPRRLVPRPDRADREAASGRPSDRRAGRTVPGVRAPGDRARPGGLLAHAGPSSKAMARVVGASGGLAFSGRQSRLARRRVGGWPGGSREGRLHLGTLRRGARGVRSGHRPPTQRRRAPLRRRLGALPTPTPHRGHRPLRRSSGAWRRRPLDQDRLRGRQRLPRAGRDRPGSRPLRRLPEVDPPGGGLRRRPDRRGGQPGLRREPEETADGVTPIRAAPGRPDRGGTGLPPIRLEAIRETPIPRTQPCSRPSGATRRPMAVRPRIPAPGAREGPAGAASRPLLPKDRPRARLDSALKDVREARSRRPPDPPPAVSKGSRKDW